MLPAESGTRIRGALLSVCLAAGMLVSPPSTAAAEPLQELPSDAATRDALGLSAAQDASAEALPGRVRGSVLTVTLVVREGDLPPGGGGNPVTTLGSPFTDGVGNVGFTGAVDAGGSSDAFVWVDSGIVWRNSDALVNMLSGAESTMGVGDSGEFLYSPSVDGGDAVWSEGGLVLRGGDAAPGFPVGTLNVFNSRPTLLPGGAGYWIAGFDESGGGSDGRVLYTSPSATAGDVSVVLRSDDMVGGFTIDRPSGVGFDYQISDDGSHHIHDLLMDTGSTADDGFLYVDGTLPARESTPTGDGDNWDNFDVVSINDSGDYIFSGDTDGATGSDEFLAYNGAIAVREGDVLDDIPLTSTAAVLAASIDNLGRAAHAWSFAGGEALFFACEAADLASSVALLATGDMVDVDGGGGADATVTDLNASNIIGPGLWLAENDRVFLEVDLDDGGGAAQAIIGIELPECSATIFSDGFESGDTSAWNG